MGLEVIIIKMKIQTILATAFMVLAIASAYPFGGHTDYELAYRNKIQYSPAQCLKLSKLCFELSDSLQRCPSRKFRWAICREWCGSLKSATMGINLVSELTTSSSTLNLVRAHTHFIMIKTYQRKKRTEGSLRTSFCEYFFLLCKNISDILILMN